MMDEMDNSELKFDPNLGGYGNIAIEPATVEVPIRSEGPQEFIDVNDMELPDVSSESDDSDFIIRLDDEDVHPCEYHHQLENSHVSNVLNTADDDDDFCIVYEKYTPTPDIQVVVNYRPSSIPKRNRTIHSQSQQDNSMGLGNIPHESSENHGENPSPNSFDDSVCIIDEIPPVNLGTLQINKEAILTSSEKKKRKIECGVCFDGPDEIAANGRNLVSTTCGHIFCNECVKMALKATKQCPQCRKKLTAKQYHPIYI